MRAAPGVYFFRVLGAAKESMDRWAAVEPLPPYSFLENHTRVSLGKAAHRCHGDLRCLERCILFGPWVSRRVRGGWFKDADGNWRR